MTEANRCVGGGLIIVEFAPLLTPEGLRRVQEFIQSLNVYGTTPFLYPIYGGGDVLQSFCRINNVYESLCSFNMTEKFYSESYALACTFNNTGNIRKNKILAGIELYNT